MDHKGYRINVGVFPDQFGATFDAKYAIRNALGEYVCRNYSRRHWGD